MGTDLMFIYYCYDSVLICINDCLACLLCIVYCRDIN